jgi:hypothetical protein
VSRSGIEESLATALAHAQDAASRAHTLARAGGRGRDLPVHPDELAEALRFVSEIMFHLGVTLGHYGDTLLNPPHQHVPEPLQEPAAGASRELRVLGHKLRRGVRTGNAYTAIGVLDDALAAWRIQIRRVATNAADTTARRKFDGLRDW